MIAPHNKLQVNHAIYPKLCIHPDITCIDNQTFAQAWHLWHFFQGFIGHSENAPFRASISNLKFETRSLLYNLQKLLCWICFTTSDVPNFKQHVLHDQFKAFDIGFYETAHHLELKPPASKLYVTLQTRYVFSRGQFQETRKHWIYWFKSYYQKTTEKSVQFWKSQFQQARSPLKWNLNHV